MTVYAMSNPMFLSDTFVFAFDGQFYSFVKINYKNKIEEIGFDILKRTHYKTFDQLVLAKNVTKATKLQASIYRRIDKEYFGHLYNQENFYKNN